MIGSLGWVKGQHSTLEIVPGIVEFHAGDYAVHLATALFFLVLGLLKRSDVAPQSGASTKPRPVE